MTTPRPIRLGHLALFVGVALLASVCGIAAAPAAEQTIGTLRWSEQQKLGLLKSGKVETRAGENPSECLKIEQATPGQSVIPLVVLDNPGVKWPAYVLRGKIRYENLAETSFVEMWNYFPDGSYYFTRTLGDAGPMGKLVGSSDWRDIELPFTLAAPGQNTPSPGPNRLALNLVLAGPGTVELGPLEIVQLSGAPASWWSSSAGGWIGALVGTSLGLMGAVMGICFRFSWGPRLAIWLAGFAMVSGLALLAAGAMAFFSGQPRDVYYPLLLCGTLAAAVMGCQIPLIIHLTRQQELRRMEALDVA